MVFRKHNSSAGFSLIEVLVAITLLGLVAVPIGSSLAVSFRLNTRSEALLQAQLAVSSAVETIMAEGFTRDDDYAARFPDVTVRDLGDGGAAYHITVTAKAYGSITVTTHVRPAQGGVSG